MFDIFTFNQSSARWNKTGKWAPDVGLRADSSAFSSYKGLKGQKLKIVTVEVREPIPKGLNVIIKE